MGRYRLVPGLFEASLNRVAALRQDLSSGLVAFSQPRHFPCTFLITCQAVGKALCDGAAIARVRHEDLECSGAVICEYDIMMQGARAHRQHVGSFLPKKSLFEMPARQAFEMLNEWPCLHEMTRDSEDGLRGAQSR